MYFNNHLLFNVRRYVPISVAVRSKEWVCGRLLAGIAGSNLAEVMDVCLLWVLYVCVCVCVLSGRGLCVVLITRPEESYRVCESLSVIVKSRWAEGHDPLEAVGP